MEAEISIRWTLSPEDTGGLLLDTSYPVTKTGMW